MKVKNNNLKVKSISKNNAKNDVSAFELRTHVAQNQCFDITRLSQSHMLFFSCGFGCNLCVI